MIKKKTRVVVPRRSRHDGSKAKIVFSTNLVEIFDENGLRRVRIGTF